MTYRITQSEIRRRKILAIKCFVIGIAPIVVPFSIGGILQKDIALLCVILMTAATCSYVAIKTTRRVLQALLENPVVVSEDGLVFPCGSGVVQAPWTSMLELRIKNREPLSLILRCRGVSRTKLTGYENMDKLLQELLCHIPKEKVKKATD